MTKWMAAAAVLVCVSVGCSEKVAEYATEKAIESSSDENVDIDYKKMGTDEGEVRVTNKDTGEEVVYKARGDYPDDHPAGFDQYPGSAVLASTTVSEQGAMVQLETDDDMDAIMAHFAKAASAHGWTEEATMTMGGMRMASYTKGDEQVQVNVQQSQKGDEKNIIMLTFAKDD